MKLLSFDVGMKNLAFCLLDENHTIYQWGVINVLEEATTKKIDPDILTHLVWDQLDKYPGILEAEKVVIENQPSLKNPKMKTMQIIILSYFVSKQRSGDTQIKKIDCFAPRNKLNVYQGEQRQQIEESITCKSVYSKTKKLSVEFTKVMIKDQPEWLSLITSSKKKDDLADSFIQGACYLSRIFPKPGEESGEKKNPAEKSKNKKVTTKKVENNEPSVNILDQLNS